MEICVNEKYLKVVGKRWKEGIKLGQREELEVLQGRE